jgi:hypothetical protein
LFRLALSPDIVGKRIELNRSHDPYSDVKPGDRGTVVDVSELPYEHMPFRIGVHWDSGSRLKFNEAIGEPTEEVDEDLEINLDMLYLVGLCEQNNDEYGFCKPANSYVDENNLEQLDERPEQLSQETIDKINEFDWNEDGVTDGSDFISKPSNQ